MSLHSLTISQTQGGVRAPEIAVPQMRGTFMDRAREPDRSGSALPLWADGILGEVSRWRRHCVKAGCAARSGAATADGNEDSSLPDGGCGAVSETDQDSGDCNRRGATKQGDSQSGCRADGSRFARACGRAQRLDRRFHLGTVTRDEKVIETQRRVR